MKKYICNLMKQRSVITGYEQTIEADTREEALTDYLYWLNEVEGCGVDESDVEVDEIDYDE